VDSETIVALLYRVGYALDMDNSDPGAASMNTPLSGAESHDG